MSRTACAGEGFFALLAITAIICYTQYGDKKMKDLHNRDLTFRAQELRKNATKQENHLWYDFLSPYPIRFRRQVTIDRFIVDFLCAKAKLVIEVDGSQHFSEQGLAYDAERTAVLNALGYTVLRVTNDDVDHNFNGVCEMIDREIKNRINMTQVVAALIWQGGRFLICRRPAHKTQRMAVHRLRAFRRRCPFGGNRALLPAAHRRRLRGIPDLRRASKRATRYHRAKKVPVHPPSFSSSPRALL